MHATGFSEVLELTRALVQRESLTPNDEGCQPLLAKRLESLGFSAEWLPHGEVNNVILTHGDRSADTPSLWFLGHTDVVPTGPASDWSHPPFDAQVEDGWLFGRGVADMKGGVAAMVVALERFAQAHPEHRGEIGLILTSDEEGIAVDGIKKVAVSLAAERRAPDYCLVGEPSSQKQLGDTVRIGRRGSINAELRINGIQGHVAFPQHLKNPVHDLAPLLAELTATNWDDGSEDFPPTSCQVSNIQAGTGAANVTPSQVVLKFNFRNNPASSSDSLRHRVDSMLARHAINDFELDWWVSGHPFYSEPGPLREAVVKSVQEVLQIDPDCNTGGGTSDGRFMAPLGCEVVELGLMNTSIHQIDERTPVADLDRLCDTYLAVLRRIYSG